MLAKSRAAALAFYEKLLEDTRFLTAFAPELDIVVWMPRAERVSESSEISRLLFSEAAQHDLHLALAELPIAFFDTAAAKIERDRETVACLRSTLMKPDHLEWVDPIWRDPEPIR